MLASIRNVVLLLGVTRKRLVRSVPSSRKSVTLFWPARPALSTMPANVRAGGVVGVGTVLQVEPVALVVRQETRHRGHAGDAAVELGAGGHGDVGGQRGAGVEVVVAPAAAERQRAAQEAAVDDEGARQVPAALQEDAVLDA